MFNLAMFVYTHAYILIFLLRRRMEEVIQVRIYIYVHTYRHACPNMHKSSYIATYVCISDISMKQVYILLPYSGYTVQGPNLCELCKLLQTHRI